VDAGNFIQAKVEEDADYKDRLRARFEEIGH
jgi:hypothetical protein